MRSSPAQSKAVGAMAAAPLAMALALGFTQPVHTPSWPQKPQVPMPELMGSPFISRWNTQVARGPVTAEVRMAGSQIRGFFTMLGIWSMEVPMPWLTRPPQRFSRKERTAKPTILAQQPAPAAPPAPSAQNSQETPPSGEISRDEALAIALANASVPEADAYNVKVERDGDNGIPLWDIEFETEYGDYDFEVALSGGRIVGADYEVDDEWLDRLGGNPITADEAKAILQSKAPGVEAGDIALREEHSDGRLRYEGEAWGGRMK